MKRQIKFRGKRVDTGEWVIGCLVGYHQAYYDGNSNRVCIDSGILTTTEVDPDTVGQFTGLLNKNGKEIYEGDILFIGEDDDIKIYNEVGIKDGCFGYIGEIDGELIPFCHSNVTEEIVGNIHDNPELLKGGK